MGRTRFFRVTPDSRVISMDLQPRIQAKLGTEPPLRMVNQDLSSPVSTTNPGSRLPPPRGRPLVLSPFPYLRALINVYTHFIVSLATHPLIIMPEEKISWKESNLALIGSDLDKKIKQAAAGGEDAWQSIGDAPGVKVWRIEQFKIVPWPEKDNGCFYQGDSYIVLNSYLIEDRLYRDLYIWIGAESSQDEYGTAAYKASL